MNSKLIVAYIEIMDLKTIINSIGLILNIAGVLVVYFSSPINHDVIDGGSASTNYDQIGRETKRKNTLLKAGVWIVVAGSVLQLISNFVPPSVQTTT